MTTCPNGHQNAPGGRYCSACAAPLGAMGEEPAPPPPPALPPMPPGALLPSTSASTSEAPNLALPPAPEPPSLPSSAVPGLPVGTQAPPPVPPPSASAATPNPMPGMTSAPTTRPAHDRPGNGGFPAPGWSGVTGGGGYGPPPGQPPSDPAPAEGPDGDQSSWYHQTWVVGLGLVLCFPLGLVGLWTHPRWTTRTKQVVSGVLAIFVLLAVVTDRSTPGDNAEQVAIDVGSEREGDGGGASDTGATRPSDDPDLTSTTRSTTTTAPPTTTIDTAVLRAEYDAQVAASCEAATQASLAVDDTVAAIGESDSYDDRWVPHAPESRFMEDLQYCTHQRREERRANECGARPEVELLARDPDSYSGQCFTLVLRITQFDQATGRCGFRAYFDTVAHEWNFEYRGDNSVILYPEPCPQLDSLGTDDVVRTRLVVVGGLTYDTTIGGSATAVQFVPVGDPEILQNN